MSTTRTPEEISREIQAACERAEQSMIAADEAHRMAHVAEIDAAVKACERCATEVWISARWACRQAHGETDTDVLEYLLAVAEGNKALWKALEPALRESGRLPEGA